MTVNKKKSKKCIKDSDNHSRKNHSKKKITMRKTLMNRIRKVIGRVNSKV